MNTKIQKHSVGRILGIAAILLVLGMLLLVPMIASGAEDDAPLQMEAGASVRINTPTGLRFTASLSAAEYARIVDATGEAPAMRSGYEVGMLILPKTYFEAFAAQTEVTDIIDWVNAEHPTQQINLGFSADQFILNETTGRYEFSGAIVSIKEANFDLEFSALAYVEDGTTRTYAESQSDVRTVVQVTKAAIESGKYSITQMNTLSAAYGVSYSSVNVTLPTIVGGATETLTIVGENIKFSDINALLDTRKGYHATAFLDEETAVEMSAAPTLGTTYTVENIAVDVNFTYIDGSTETIEAVYGTGLKKAPKAFDPTLAINCDYTGDYKTLTAEKDVVYSLATVGTQNTGSVTVNTDGSLTVKNAASTNMVGGYLFNMAGADLTNKAWTISIDMKVEDFPLWDQYGIVVTYTNGKYVLFGARKTNDLTQSVLSILPNNEWNGANWLTAQNAYFISGWPTTETLNLKLSYYGGQYFVYYNDVLFAIYNAVEFKNLSSEDVTTYGAPTAFGFGYRVDDFGTTTTPQMTYSDWTWSIEGDGTWTAPSLAGSKMWAGTTAASVGQAAYVDNKDGTYTFTKPTELVDGGILLAAGLAGKDWTVETEIEIDTANVTKWNTFGFYLVYGSGDKMAIGPSVRHDTDMTILDIIAWRNGIWDNATSVQGINSMGKDQLCTTYQSNTTLKMRLAYEDGYYYMFLNDMLCMMKTATNLGVNAYGDIVSVGFGGNYSDPSQNGLPRTYSNCHAYVEGDAGYVSPTANDAIKLLLNNETYEGSATINADGSLTFTSNISTTSGQPMGTFKSKIAGFDVTGKNWTVQMSVSMDDVQKWHTYGIALEFTDGTKWILGLSFVLDNDALFIKSLNAGGAWQMDFVAATNTVKSDYSGNITFKVTYSVTDDTYTFWANDALCGTKTATDLKIASGNKPVAVGLGARCDDAAPGKATFSNLTATASAPTTQEEE